MKTIENAMINFAYFTANFPYDFIEKCWSDENNLIAHLKRKFESRMNNEGFIDYNGFMKFFLDLDRTNQKKLVRWVNENYQGINE